MHIQNRVFIVVFLTLIIIPLLFVDFRTGRISIQENRMLAERPRIADIKSNPGKFKREFDAWFKDSTGFREQLIKVYDVIDRNRWMSGIQYVNGQYTYLVGEEGHHYFADVGGRLIPKFQGKKILSEEQLTSLADKIEEINTYLDSKDIPLIVMFCTDKESVYPEFYPKSIKRGPEPIPLDQITRYLQQNTSADVFNIRKALLTEKKSYLLYNASFGDLTHYNEIGAFFAYRELMKHINVYFPDIKPFEIDDVDITYGEKEIPTISLRKKTYKNLDPSFFDDVDLTRPFTLENYANENTDHDFPVILIFGDSYANDNYLGKYLAQHFSTTIKIHYGNIGSFRVYVEKYNPDIVVFETAERQIEVFPVCVLQIPKLSINW